MKRSELTPELIRLMSPEDQAKYSGQVTFTVTEPTPHEPLEREEQRTFAKACNSWRSEGKLDYNYCRTDKRTTHMVGWPDFSLYLPGGKTVFIEFKREGAWLTREQEATKAFLQSMGFTYFICRTAKQAIEVMLPLINGKGV